MGCSCGTFREEPLARPCVAQAEPSSTAFAPHQEGSRDPAFVHGICSGSHQQRLPHTKRVPETPPSCMASARAGFSFWRIDMQASPRHPADSSARNTIETVFWLRRNEVWPGTLNATS
jgi:hypothetical protein